MAWQVEPIRNGEAFYAQACGWLVHFDFCSGHSASRQPLFCGWLRHKYGSGVRLRMVLHAMTSFCDSLLKMTVSIWKLQSSKFGRSLSERNPNLFYLLMNILVLHDSGRSPWTFGLSPPKLVCTSLFLPCQLRAQGHHSSVSDKMGPSAEGETPDHASSASPLCSAIATALREGYVV